MRIQTHWHHVTDVKAPELRATWVELRIDVGDACATLVEDANGELRTTIGVAAYPLAEWIAYGWWQIVAPTGRSGRGFSVSGAGDGFPWPDIMLHSGPGYTLATLRPAKRPAQAVRFLATGAELMEPARARQELSDFVSGTVDRLEGAGICDTPLQNEWSAIQLTDEKTAAFCVTAAAMGLDPYDLSDSESALVLSFADGIADPVLLADLAAVTSPSDAGATHAWALAALARLEGSNPQGTSLDLPLEPLFSEAAVQPWEVGYHRARELRAQLGIADDARVDVEDLVAVVDVAEGPPEGLVALAGVRAQATTVVVPAHVSDASKRFAGARAIGRRTFDAHQGFVLSGGVDYAAKVERAFAAEFLAPARGIGELIAKAPDTSVEAAAGHYRVDPQVIAHQMENQLGLGGF